MRLRLQVCSIALLLFALPLAVSPIPASHRVQAAEQHQVLIPTIMLPPPPNPFGFDLRVHSGDDVLAYGAATRPKWARAGDVDWSYVELQPRVYYWGELATFEANVRRLRAAGIEPVGIIQRSPTWAQSIPGRRCSAPKLDAIDELADFTYSLAQRYSKGDLAVHYWEFWNEPDFAPSDIRDDQAVGCWGNGDPDNGGKYYGEVLRRVNAAIKAGNPQAMVFAGALASFGPKDTRNERFLRGMLSTAPDSFDALSFHAYGEWSASDLLVYKTDQLRRILGEYNRASRPLVATEVAATCERDTVSSCKPNYDAWLGHQANFAARIYAEAIALNLMGAFWYTLSIEDPGFAYSHIIDLKNGEAKPRPAYYAFRNSSSLLAGARYVGPAVKVLDDNQLEEVQELKFRQNTSTLYVLWVPRLDFPKISYEIKVKPGATAICTQSLHLDVPSRYSCSDTNKDGVLRLAIGPLPYYVEVMD